MGFSVARFDLEYGQTKEVPRAHDFNSEPGFLSCSQRVVEGLDKCVAGFCLTEVRPLCSPHLGPWLLVAGRTRLPKLVCSLKRNDQAVIN